MAIKVLVTCKRVEDPESNIKAMPDGRFVAFREVKSERPELTEARVVVAGGRGTKGDLFQAVPALARAVKGAS